MELWEQFKSLFEKKGDGPRSKLTSRLLLLLLLGAGLMLINSLFSLGREKEPAGPVQPVQQESAEQDLVKELTEMLNRIQGVKNASIILTREKSGRLELVKDHEQTGRQTKEDDGSGGSREIAEETLRETHVILRDAQGKETPLVIQENEPCYRGVLVVADGVDNPVVQARVVEALKAVLNISAHRITVLPREVDYED